MSVFYIIDISNSFRQYTRLVWHHYLKRNAKMEMKILQVTKVLLRLETYCCFDAIQAMGWFDRYVTSTIVNRAHWNQPYTVLDQGFCFLNETLFSIFQSQQITVSLSCFKFPLFSIKGHRQAGLLWYLDCWTRYKTSFK